MRREQSNDCWLSLSRTISPSDQVKYSIALFIIDCFWKQCDDPKLNSNFGSIFCLFFIEIATTYGCKFNVRQTTFIRKKYI